MGVCLTLLFFLVISTLPVTVLSESAKPTEVVQSIANELAKAVNNQQGELKNNREKLIELVDSILLPHFDIDYAAILVLGQHARSSTPEQRTRFAKAFYNSIAHRYAEGLLKYTEGSVKVLSDKGELNDKRTIVRTEVILDDGKHVSVDYAFRRTKEGEWKAYDVVIEGISYVTNYRNQVAAEISKTNLDALIQRLETQGERALGELENQH